MTVSNGELREKFLASFKRADSIEVDGFFIRHFDNTVHTTSGAPDALVVEVSAASDVVGDVDLFLSESDFSNLSFDESSKVWSVGEHDVSFYAVTPLSE